MKILSLVLFLLCLMSCSNSKDELGAFDSNSPIEMGDVLDEDNPVSVPDQKPDNELINAAKPDNDLVEVEVERPQNKSQFLVRFLNWDRENLYIGTMSFQLNLIDDKTAYFSNLYLENYYKIEDKKNIAVISKRQGVSILTKFDEAKNSLVLSNSKSRFFSLNLDFKNHELLNDVEKAGMILSEDMKIMIGSDNTSFFFIGQKQDDQTQIVKGELKGKWDASLFDVDENGIITKYSGPEVQVLSVPNSKTRYSFKSKIDSNEREYGVIENLNENIQFYHYSNTDKFMQGNKVNNIIINDENRDGLFILSPDGKYILGVDINSSRFISGKVRN
ncbi:hypothetical protein HBN50_12850 [Halobacteriovorax sp. GB3]|uniref:hypothetical protein n=1 Tax=Halobacteriovorax sp. GB3 TaxID=2719615 RepID=UPI00235FCB3D|nr:hypothetical protein [Halobacteriovorax sp. GB3]MDD0853993.1 hypothetical protein [Halobacteriovorax sp. GB3]